MTVPAEPEKYATFWREFGRVLKESVADDHGNRDAIARLLQFTSTASAADEQAVSLNGCVAPMKEGQEGNTGEQGAGCPGQPPDRFPVLHRGQRAGPRTAHGLLVARVQVAAAPPQ